MKKTVTVFLSFAITTGFNFSYCQLWRMYSDSAKIINAREKSADAIFYYSKAKEILEKDSIYSAAYGQVCIGIADIYNLSGQQKQIIPFLQTAAIAIEKNAGKSNMAYALVADKLGQSYLSVSPDDAEAYFLESMKIREARFGKESNEYATACNNLGIFYSRTGQFKKSESFHLEAKRIKEKNLPKDDPDIARSYNNLANVYWNMGDFEKAEPLALEAIRIREKNPGKGSRDYAITCMNLGNIYRDMGQNEKAEHYYTEGKNIRDSLFGKKNDDYLESSLSLANLYSITGQYERAEPLYLEVRQTRGEINKNSFAYGLSCNNLGDLYSNLGQYEKAEKLLLEAKEIWNQLLDKENPNHAFNRNSLGQLYFAEGQYKKAESYFLEARQLWEKIIGKVHAYYIQNTNNLARIYWDMNKVSKADEFYSLASVTQYDLIGKAFQFTNENEKGLYLKNIIGASDEFYSFYYRKFSSNNASRPFNISLQNRNLILTSSQQMKQVLYNSKDTVLEKVFNEWIDLKAQLAHLYSQGTAKTDQIKQTEEKADNKEKQLSRLSSEFAKLQKKVSWQDIQKHLKNNEAAIEFTDFHLYNGRRWTDSVIYIALVCRKDRNEPVLVPLCEKRELDNLLNTKFENEIDAVNHFYTSADLCNLIWHPIEKYLSGIKQIYFAPAGNLFKVSFYALPLNNKTVLGEKYRLVQLNTTATVLNNRQTFIHNTDNVQLYGGIEYDADSTVLKQAASFYRDSYKSLRSLPDDLTRGSSFRYLPGTKDEVESIEKMAVEKGVAVSVLSGIRASEESFDSLNNTSSPAVLHIATHGFFFDNPYADVGDSLQLKFQTSGKTFRQSENPLFRAGLLFAGANNAWRGRFVNGTEDGIATAYEISNMYLPNTKLVVLSACETALGDIKGSEGVYGLQRAFKMAGVENMVMSLWKVPDKETSEFMEEFYKNLFAKKSIENAFYRAQGQMRIRYRDEPFKWAAWILVK